MKAVVVEIKSKYAALLLDDGTVIKTRNNNYSIGDVINMRDKTLQKKIRFGTMIAIAASLVMIVNAGIWAYTAPYYYISLDVNPSLMLEANVFERVIGMEAVNEDAAIILDELDLNNMDVEDAISEAVAHLAETGYFDEEDGNIVIASGAKNDQNAERLSGKIKGAVEEEIAQKGVKAEVSAGPIGYEMVQEAKDLGITPGKLNLIRNLLGEELGDNINEPVSELMKRFAEKKGAEGKAKGQEAAGGEHPGQGAGKPEQPGNTDPPVTDKIPPQADQLPDNAAENKPEESGPPDELPGPPVEVPQPPQAPGGNADRRP